MKSTRTLVWNDTFRIARIINSAHITADEIYDIIATRDRLQASAKNRSQKEDELIKLGTKVICYILDKAPGAEKPLNEFLASMAGVKAADIEKAGITEIIELIMDIFDNNKDIKDFFIYAIKSPKAIK